jgi:hypothetical protein
VIWILKSHRLAKELVLGAGEPQFNPHATLEGRLGEQQVAARGASAKTEVAGTGPARFDFLAYARARTTLTNQRVSQFERPLRAAKRRDAPGNPGIGRHPHLFDVKRPASLVDTDQDKAIRAPARLLNSCFLMIGTAVPFAIAVPKTRRKSPADRGSSASSLSE